MASMIAFPRESHLKAVFQFISFIKSKYNVVTMLDHADPDVDKTQFLTEHWSETPYGPYKEDVPPNVTLPRGTCFTMRYFDDYDHAGDSIARRSRTGFIVSP